MGHMLVYTIGDVVTRFRARNGMHVLHPQGFDSFGLPAENAAIREGVHPRESTERNIEHDHALDAARRLGVRLGSLLSTTTPSTTAGSSGSSCASSSAGSRTGRARRSSGARTTRRCSRTSRCSRRALRALRRRGRVAPHGAVVLPHHRLRAGAARRPRDGRLARSRSRRGSATGSAARRAPEILFRIEELDEDIPSSRLVRTRSTARRSSCSRPSTSSSPRIDSDEVRDYVRRAGGEEDRGARRGDREDRRLHGLHAINPVNGERLPCTSPTTS